MTKLLQNKPIIKLLGIALSILLIVALIPQINIAYGSKDDVLADDTAAAVEGEGTALPNTSGVDTEGEEAEDAEEPQGEEPDTSLEGTTPEGEPAAQAAVPSDSDPEAMETAAIPAKARAAARATKTLSNNTNATVEANEIAAPNDGKTLVFNKSGNYTLTINGTLEGDIKISGGAKVTIKGAGTIKGTGTSSVIIVEGKNDNTQLTFNGPMVTGGVGKIPANNSWGTAGGGILVCRAEADYNMKGAILILRGGTIRGNEANAGGGIFIDYNCGFTMTGGTIESNTATLHEGGGIFTDGKWDGGSAEYGYISGGIIKNNKTQTKTDWGGGGVYINNNGVLRIDSARITANTAKGLGGGIAGCPHAKMGIGKLENGAAVYGNTAQGETSPKNAVLMFNMPAFAKGSSIVPSGDFLVMGLDKAFIQEAKKNSAEKYIGANDESLKYTSSNTTYTLTCGDYAKKKFRAELANDWYCTLGSYIGATNLGSHPTKDGKAIAWEGFVALVPMSKVHNNIISDHASDGSSNWLGSEIAINANETYEVHDATLCLKNTATEDKTGINRKVVIEGNSSDTHGGGIACNGTVSFGSFTNKEEIINPYSLVLTKKLEAAISKANIDLTEADTFKFTLTDKSDPSKVYSAVSNKSGDVIFTDLPGAKESANKTFVLKEELTEAQKTAGYESPIPDGGIEVEVKLDVTKSTTEYAFTTTTTYTTTPTVKSIAGANTTTITNKLNLKGSVEIPVTKIADGIGAGRFSFTVQEVAAPVSGNAGSTITLPSGKTVGKLEAAKNAQPETLTIDLAESSSKKTEGKTSFKREYTAAGTHWYLISEAAGNDKTISYDTVACLVRVDVKESDDHRNLNTTTTIWKADSTDATTLTQLSGSAGVSFENVAIKYADTSLALTKQILTTLGAELDLNGRAFGFALIDEDDKEVAKGSTDKETGKLALVLSESYTKQAYEFEGGEKTFTFTLKETPLAEESADAGHLTTITDAKVEIALATSAARTTLDDRTVFLVTPQVKGVTVNGTDITAETDNSVTVTNRYAPHGSWQFEATKHFYGFGAPAGCTFVMAELAAAPDLSAPLSQVQLKEGTTQTRTLASADFDTDKNATVTFDAINYEVKGNSETAPSIRDDRGDHYYIVYEDGSAAKDTTVYLIKVTVAVTGDGSELTATQTIIGYADDMDSPINEFPENSNELVEFYNTDTYGLYGASSYSVYAASNEPVDQVCYVDPKIYKNLEGRAIKSGEFAFKLIQVNNYNDTEGTVISSTTNDEFGMVDFDKANNVSGDLENPSCLAYTSPGTYFYRVIEDTSKGGMNDQSVIYSDQVITFTTVITQDPTTGRLECTDMYYGYWDKDANKNVRFDEQYLDYETQPANIGDMSKLNPDWHPTMTNKARPMDLQVRKTSVTDRSEGLVGATYALYMVNDNVQGDIKLAEATSEEGGWITYKGVSLSTNNLYYFKETAAPAGHTVSEFRSSYFSLVEDPSSANGYALKYSDTKYRPEAEVAMAGEAAEPQAADVGTVPLEADAQAAPAAEAATDNETQPGYSPDGSVLLTYDKDGGVYDEATQLQVSKLDTRTHEWVEGADLVILEKDSGKEIASWTSGKAPQKLEKTLNVGTTYLLREAKAPDTYNLANDVEFVIDSYGNVSITKGTENGNAELSDNTISLYDTMMDAEEVVKQEREKVREEPKGIELLLAQTGDMLPILGIVLVALIALGVLVVAKRRRGSAKDNDTEE